MSVIVVLDHPQDLVNIAHKTIIYGRMLPFMRLNHIAICTAQTNRITIICLQLRHNLLIDKPGIHHGYNLQCLGICYSSAFNHLLFYA